MKLMRKSSTCLYNVQPKKIVIMMKHDKKAMLKTEIPQAHIPGDRALGWASASVSARRFIL